MARDLPRGRVASPASRKRRERNAARREARELVDGRWVCVNPLVSHGFESTYINWGCRCTPCTAANSRAQADHRERRRRQGRRVLIDGRWTCVVYGVEHGHYSTYLNWSCRCVPCTDAATGARAYTRRGRAS